MAYLTLVPTPIGNLEDITLRALRVLREADVIAAEDTRHSLKLLQHHGIAGNVVRLDAHTMEQRGDGVLSTYNHIALISDAGTPGISDPGAELVRLALMRGDHVEVLPGATAVIPALVLSNFPLSRFAFEGFLPRKGSARKTRLQQLATTPYTTAFYESPQRLHSTLADLITICGETRLASVSRELSKTFETTYRGTLSEVKAALPEVVKGEVVVVLGPSEEIADEVDFVSYAERLWKEGLDSRAVRGALIALGAPRNVAYTLSLHHKP